MDQTIFIIAAGVVILDSRGNPPRLGECKKLPCQLLGPTEEVEWSIPLSSPLPGAESRYLKKVYRFGEP